jgi:hypothetical protein
MCYEHKSPVKLISLTTEQTDLVVFTVTNDNAIYKWHPGVRTTRYL